MKLSRPTALRAFFALARTQILLNVRQPEIIILTFGLPLLSMFVFGALFSGETPISLGFVDSDGSTLARGVEEALRDTRALKIQSYDESTAQKKLADGDITGLLVLPEGFASSGRILYYKAKSSPIVEGMRDATVSGIIAGVNQQLAAAATLQLTLADQGTTGEVARTIDFLAPGMMGLSIMYLNFGAGIFLVSWRQQGVLRRLQATPLRPAILIASQMASSWLFSIFQVAVLFLVARVVFGVEMRGSYPWLVLITVVGVTAMLSLGYLVAAFIQTPQAASGLVNLIAFPMMFLGGSYFPVDSVPAVVKPIVAVMPLTHLNDALRAVINHGDSIDAFYGGLIILGAWSVACFAAAARVFRWT